MRPNSGRVEPGESVEVSGKRMEAASPTMLNPFLLSSVMLQPLKEEPPLNSKCKDKFLVQSTFITPEKETMALHDLASAKTYAVVPLLLNPPFLVVGSWHRRRRCRSPAKAQSVIFAGRGRSIGRGGWNCPCKPASRPWARTSAAFFRPELSLMLVLS